MSTSFQIRRTLLAAGLAAIAVPVLSACTPEPPVEFNGSDISGTGLGREMVMQDTSGTARSLKDYHGKVAVIFFGFTQCPDVCPTSMAELAQTMELLGEDAKQVQVIMITVDPDRDTPEILAEYVKAFHPDFIGLSGTADELQATAQSFKAFYAKAKGPTAEQYTMDHSSSFYVFDKSGDVRVLMAGNAPADEIAHDIRQLL